MPRRKKVDASDGLIALVALLPWWAGVAAGLIAYLILHRLAQRPLAASTDPRQIVDMMTGSMWHAAAVVGQYVLPLICLAGAAVSAIQRRQRKALVQNVIQCKATDALDGMSWQDFEKLVGESFRLQGYQVAETGGGGADGGIDLVLTKRSTSGGENFLVQCKQWRAFKVGVDVVRELYGVMAAKGAAGGFVVTSGRFTEEATKFAEGRNIKLVDGPQLFGLLRQAQTARTAAQGRAAAPSPAPVGSVPTAMACPACTKPMIRRTAKRGQNAGQDFWGCTGYPSCRGTRPIA